MRNHICYLVAIIAVALLLPSVTSARFTSIDPKASKYPSVSPYVYGNDNPLKYQDPNGEWIESVHHDMIAKATLSLESEGRITRQDTEAMTAGSDWADSGPNQTADKSYMHAMADGSGDQPQSQEAAAADMKAHVSKNTMEFARTGDFQALGVAVHAIQDANSPSHEGFQQWTGEESVLQLLGHGVVEIVPTRGRSEEAVKATRDHIQWALMVRRAIQEQDEEIWDADENQ